MKCLTFVHVSDIHFGQERGVPLVTNTDIRDRLIDDVESFVKQLGRPADGAIVTGDIAYSGTKPEYETASGWLDKLAAAGGFSRTEVMVVPGNHDLDRGLVGDSGQHLVDKIVDKGEDQLELYLHSDTDRQALYAKFSEYRLFAGSYGCALSDAGGGSGEKSFYFDVARTRGLRLLGLNTAVVCGRSSDHVGKLLLGARQRIFQPAKDGMETIVLMHHPIHWCADETLALEYILARSRILMCGHEHVPNFQVDEIQGRGSYLTLRAGAATPPEEKPKEGESKEMAPYTYNIIEFRCDGDHLEVRLHPRDWDATSKKFKASQRDMAVGKTCHIMKLRCHDDEPISEDSTAVSVPNTAEGLEGSMTTVEALQEPSPDDAVRLANIRLKFFRHLSLPQRLSVLTTLGALPATISEALLTVTIELKALDRLVRAGMLEALEKQVAEQINQQKMKGAGK